MRRVESIVTESSSIRPVTLSDINGCEGNLAGSAIANIVSQLDDAVDLVINAHTHAAYTWKLSNAKGRAIPVTSAAYYGRLLTNSTRTRLPR